jgi:hypothetical protein
MPNRAESPVRDLLSLEATRVDLALGKRPISSRLAAENSSQSNADSASGIAAPLNSRGLCHLTEVRLALYVQLCTHKMFQLEHISQMFQSEHQSGLSRCRSPELEN